MLSLIIGIVILLVVIIFLLYITAIYNKFKRLKNAGDATLGQIKVALKKRLDMLSELVDSVKSYAKFEKTTLENITKMRSEVMKGGIKDIKKIDDASRKILGDIKVAVENYPELKTSETVNKLMESTASVEDEIARHRYTYNNIVQEYNTMIDVVPSNMIASMFSFKKMEYLEFEEGKPSLRWEV